MLANMEEAFDFARYIAARKGMRQAQLREGTHYAFSADLRLLKRLQRIAPLQWVMEDLTRRFQTNTHKALLAAAERVTPQSPPFLHATLQSCAEMLHIPAPALYLSPAVDSLSPLSFGEEAYLVAPVAWREQLSTAHWRHVLGAACGHVQNGHVPSLTVAWYAEHEPSGWAKWSALPLRATLAVWHRRAVITADRAGLICTKDLVASTQALTATVTDEVQRAVRIACLTLFADSQYFRMVCGQPGGEPLSACDEAVAVLLDKKTSPEAA